MTAPREPAVHIPCPHCGDGWVFQDAAGGFECSACDQRFLIQREVIWGYAGPHRGGRLSLVEQLCAFVARLIEPRPRDTVPPEPMGEDGAHTPLDDTPTLPDVV